jgi:hypothetical protein
MKMKMIVVDSVRSLSFGFLPLTDLAVSDHSDDEEEEPAHRGRTRRVSEKEAQRRVSYNSVVVLLNIPFMHSGNEKDEAEARKVAKAAKAARKQ